jgi:hypothetical protein
VAIDGFTKFATDLSGSTRSRKAYEGIVSVDKMKPYDMSTGSDIEYDSNSSWFLDWNESHRINTIELILDWNESHRINTIELILDWNESHRINTIELMSYMTPMLCINYTFLFLKPYVIFLLNLNVIKVSEGLYLRYLLLHNKLLLTKVNCCQVYKILYPWYVLLHFVSCHCWLLRNIMSSS